MLKVRLFTLLAMLVALPAFADCEKSGSFLLYRSSVAISERIHIATFDASAGPAYNEENCNLVADLMAAQPGVVVSFWCEPGKLSSTH